MIINFNTDNQGKALLTLSSFKGQVIVWGFAPFWLGRDRTLENLAPVPAGGFNYEVRDGVYVQSGVLSFGWQGELWVLNGNAAGDQANNVVFVQAIPDCP